MKLRYGFLAGLMLFAQPVVATETVEMADWLSPTIVDGSNYGIYPTDFYLNATEPIGDIQLDELIENVTQKLANLSLTIDENWLEGETFVAQTRADVVNRLFNSVAIYKEVTATSAVDYFVENELLLGDYDGLRLDDFCTTVEALTLATRFINHMHSEFEAGSKGLAWQVQNNGNTVYLLGSIHIGTPDLYPINQKLEQAFLESDTLVVEANILSDNQEEMLYFMQVMMYEEGSLLDDIDDEMYLKIEQASEKIGIPTQDLLMYKPWALGNTLELFSMLIDEDGEDIKQAMGIDAYYLGKAMEYEKEIVELEGIINQAEFFNNLSLGGQLEYLDLTIDSILNPAEVSNGEIFNTWIDYWVQGDIEGFREMMEIDTTTEVGQMLIGKRDKEMAQKISQMLETEGENTYFVVVGAAHLLSDGTVIDNLEGYGYNVELFYQ
ncbi:MAG: hypothetical protein ATN36_02460 [Epulopiscium sp. Nele67-Bin005]|nr:MAG: hypothetical protein ATN36_02460 [Epulopiscium sp. Nele67-Bin005]